MGSWPIAWAIPRRASRGRLTLNPIPHIDIIYTILLPMFLFLSRSGFIFGGAKPVPVDVSRLRRPRRDWALVGAAGPAVNVVIAVGLSAILAVPTFAGLADSHRVWRRSSRSGSS